METNTLLTGLQELFTNAVKAEVKNHVETGTRLDDKLHEAVAEALSNQDSDTYPCMGDVTRMVEGNFDEWFTNCMSDFDITTHVDVDDLVQTAVNDIDMGDIVSEAIDRLELVDRDDVQAIAHDQAEEYFDSNIGDHGGEGLSLSDANSYLTQVADGQDCSEGQSFRLAVLSVVNADKLKNGVSVDDGTAMSVKATGTDHEIQAILTRRRSYFEALHTRLSILLGAAPNGDGPPVTGDDAGEGIETWKNARRDAAPTHSEADEMSHLWSVAIESTKLLGLLAGLYNGLAGNHAIRSAGVWEDVARQVRVKLANRNSA